MSSDIKLEYTEVKEERNAFLKARAKKILKRKIINLIISTSIVFISILLTNGSKVDLSSFNSWITIALIIFLSIDILRFILYVWLTRKVYNTPVLDEPISIMLKANGFTYMTNKITANFSFSDIEKIEPFNKSLIIHLKKQSRETAAVKALIIYSNAFNGNISRDQFIQIFCQRSQLAQISFPIVGEPIKP